MDRYAAETEKGQSRRLPMQSWIHTHLPADIVLHYVQAADKPPIVVSETDASALSHTHVAREARLRF